MVEGNADFIAVTFTVALSVPADHAVGVGYATANGSATAPGDYLGAAGTLAFAPGQTSRAVTVLVRGDLIDEANEAFFLSLSAPAGGAVLADAQGACTIVDDDTAAIRVNDVAVIEGNSSTKIATFAVTLSTPADHAISVNAAAAQGTARSPSDFLSTIVTVTFSPGQTVKAFNVAVNGDLIDESNETFYANLFAPTGGAIFADAQGACTVIDDDTAAIRVNDVIVTEGNSGLVAVTFTVTLSVPADHAVGVGYATANGAAVAPGDYVGASGTLAFAPGQASRAVTVLVRGDLIDEANERLFLNLFAPTGGAALADAQGACTIIDDD
ncbi:MAG: Calx-beta domain-containing protein [Gemmataceae bacterium]